jgi:hypothetical protein
MKLTTIVNKNTDNKFVVDEHADLSEMQNTQPSFFGQPFGKRETYEVYRGCLICRCTVKFSHGNERRTVAYVYGSWEGETRKSTSCISAGSTLGSARAARKLIDTVLDGGKYYYGI